MHLDAAVAVLEVPPQAFLLVEPLVRIAEIPVELAFHRRQGRGHRQRPRHWHVRRKAHLRRENKHHDTKQNERDKRNARFFAFHFRAFRIPLLSVVSSCISLVRFFSFAPFRAAAGEAYAKVVVYLLVAASNQLLRA